MVAAAMTALIPGAGPPPTRMASVFNGGSSYSSHATGTVNNRVRTLCYRASAMAGDALFFRDLAYVFVAAVLGAAAAWATRQPLILGYVVGGILIGPFTPGPSVTDLH